MTIAEFAQLYVDYIEPIGKIFLFLLAIAACVMLLSYVKDREKLSDIATQFVMFFWLIFSKLAIWTGMALWWLLLFIMRAVSLIIATVRDFFVSRI